MSDMAMAIYHLARLMAGAADADSEIIRAAWPDCPANGPASRDAVQEWLEAHPEVAEAVLKVDPSSPPEPQSRGRPVTWADLTAVLEPVEWLWEGWLPYGFLTLLAGEAGAGKSVLCLRIAASILRGDPWPDGAAGPEPGGAVLWVEAEDAQALNLARAKAWGLPLERIYSPQARPDEFTHLFLDDPNDQAVLINAAARPEVRIIIVDALRGCLRDSDRKDEAVYPVVSFLASLARNLGKPILLTHHLNKTPTAEITIDRVRGSSAIVQPARVVWALDAPDPAVKEKRRLRVIKSNLAAFPPPVGIEIVEQDGAPMLIFGSAPKPPEPAGPREVAIEFLRVELQRRPRPIGDLIDLAEKKGISRKTLYRARDALGLVTITAEGKRCWSLPYVL